VAERMYPGLGTPIESGLPFDVGPGTRQAGMDVLRQQMAPAPGALPSGVMGPLMDIWRYGSILGPNLQQKMAEQRTKMTQDYYSVPSTPGPGVPSPTDIAYNLGALRPENRLGPSASGRAEPALLTDEMVANYMGARVGGGAFPWMGKRTGLPVPMPGPKPRGDELPTFGMAPGGGPTKQLPVEVQREEERKTRDERLAGQPNIPGPEDRSARHVIQQFLPPEGYPMQVLKDYNMPFVF
jgi:hypothetical protein